MLLKVSRFGGLSRRGPYRGCGIPGTVSLRDDAGERMRHNIVHFSGDAGAFILCRKTPFLFLLKFEAHRSLSKLILANNAGTP